MGRGTGTLPSQDGLKSFRSSADPRFGLGSPANIWLLKGYFSSLVKEPSKAYPILITNIPRNKIRPICRASRKRFWVEAPGLCVHLAMTPSIGHRANNMIQVDLVNWANPNTRPATYARAQDGSVSHCQQR